MRIFFCNLLWLLYALPDTLAFLWAAAAPQRAQKRVLLRILRRNAGAGYGRRWGFDTIDGVKRFGERVPVTEYADYADAIAKIRKDGQSGGMVAEPVEVLEPTSGTGSTPKLIPYTRCLRREFMAAIHPWLAGLYLGRPGLLCGRQYWSLSPNTRDKTATHGETRIGFTSDTEYLGLTSRRLSKHLMVAPPELASVADSQAFEYLTLLFLLREPNLRLISVWHPSFLTVFLDQLPALWNDLLADIREGSFRADLRVPDSLRKTLETSLPPAVRRARDLDRLDPARVGVFRRIWPRLLVISCWTKDCVSWISRLRDAFPGVWIQPKGLVATEGIVSFPCLPDGRAVGAVRSHFFEFLDRTTGMVRHLWNLEPGREYVVLLTTGGGLYRYCLHDCVIARGKFLRTPCLRFLGREGCVSDMVGEKVDLRLVEEAFEQARTGLRIALRFAFIAPHRAANGSCGYVCYADVRHLEASMASRLAAALDAALSENYHYRHARRLGQLGSLRVFALAGSPEADYQRHLEVHGIKRGDGKLLRLSREDGWHRVFKGCFVETREHALS